MNTPNTPINIYKENITTSYDVDSDKVLLTINNTKLNINTESIQYNTSDTIATIYILPTMTDTKPFPSSKITSPKS